MPRLLRLVAAAILCVAIAGCGKVLQPGAPDAHQDALIKLPDAAIVDPCKGSVALSDLGSCLAHAFCKKITDCGVGNVGDTDCDLLPFQFIGNLTSRQLEPGIGASIAAGRAGYDPVAAATCLANLESLSCKGLFSNDNPLEACGMFIGKVPSPNDCALDFECAPGNACTSVSGNSYDSTCGNDVCKPRAAAGASCATTQCQGGDHCVQESPNQICLHGDAAARCNYDNDCDNGLWCNYPGTTHTDGAGTCTAGLGKDAVCTEDRMCGGNLMCVGDNLSPAAGKCEDVSTLNAPCDNQCLGPFLCAVTTANTLGTCVAEPAEGDHCVPGAPGNGCGGGGFLTFMICDTKGTVDPSDDICRTPGDLGAVCNNGAGECNFGLVCTADVSGAATGVCHVPMPDGTACVNSNQCANGNCASNVCSPFMACQL
jgi:hypothetical protein